MNHSDAERQPEDPAAYEPDGTSREILDFDDWAEDPVHLTTHIEQILKSLATELTKGSSRRYDERSLRIRRPYLVNAETGHLYGHQLCWICVTALACRAPHLPQLRACRWCLQIDRFYARRLGLGHILPVFDWYAPPIRDLPTYRLLDWPAREDVAAAWSGVARLDRWRIENVRLACTYMEVESGEVDLYDWQRLLTVGSNRSHLYWRMYVCSNFPEIRRAIRSDGLWESAGL